MKHVSPYQFSLFRILFGSYFVIRFISLLCCGSEALSRDELTLKNPINPLSWVPNVLTIFNDPLVTQLFLILLVILSIALILGLQRRLISLLLLYGLFCLHNPNVLMGHQSFLFLGTLLLVLAATPRGEPWSRSPETTNWKLSPKFYWGTWILLWLRRSRNQ